MYIELDIKEKALIESLNSDRRAPVPDRYVVSMYSARLHKEVASRRASNRCVVTGRE